MTTKTPVQFKVTAGEPLTLEVTSREGKKHTLRVAVAVFEVNETDAKDQMGRPVFELRAALALEPVGKPVESQS